MGQASFNALSIMAQKNGTLEHSPLMLQALNEGQTLHSREWARGQGWRNGTATGGPIQVDMLTAQSPSGYDGRLYSLLPIANLGNTYYSPVSTTNKAAERWVGPTFLHKIQTITQSRSMSLHGRDGRLPRASGPCRSCLFLSVAPFRIAKHVDRGQAYLGRGEPFHASLNRMNGTVHTGVSTLLRRHRCRQL